MTMALGQYQAGPDDKEGLIAWQDPEPGKPAPDGLVTVGVYRTTELKLSDYRDLDQISVGTELKNDGIVVDVKEEGSDKPKGTILDQFPLADAVVKKGQTVSLIVSSGHPPDAPTSAPDASTPGASVPEAPPPTS
jgi:beta-lactam-binding protein with PASTA domain